ncbi:hypothetical protein Leryth_017215 [Lithospermum erythrorhizon]|nr:hypothetical protein Leryth_017215 [Lithospermum erythrorhizon]
MQKIDEIKKKGHKPRGNTSTMSSEASSTGFNRCKQAMPSPQLHPNSPGPLMSRLSILISPSRSSSQLSLHSSFPNNRTFPSVNEIQSGPSPSAPPIEDLDIIEDPQCKFPSTYQKQPIGSDEAMGLMLHHHIHDHHHLALVLYVWMLQLKELVYHMVTWLDAWLV